MFEYLKRYRKRFPNRKFFQLIDKVYDFQNLEDAWKKVKANKGSAGIDKETIHQFWIKKETHFKEMQRLVKQQRYKATPVLRKLIPKDNGKFRPLGIPIVKDRVLQQATKNVLEPIFETTEFHSSIDEWLKWDSVCSRITDRGILSIKNHMMIFQDDNMQLLY